MLYGRPHVFPSVSLPLENSEAASCRWRPSDRNSLAGRHKISRFTCIETLEDNTYGLFNTLTRAIGTLPIEIWEAISTNDSSDDDITSQLVNAGFLVEADLDESQILAHWRASQIYDLTQLTYMISPTKACNMACSYCVHGNRTRADHMSPDTARVVLDFMVKDIEIKGPCRVRLDFGGAEATMNPKILIYLAEGLSRFCRGRGIPLAVGLITNGLALSNDLVTTLVAFDLKRIRVTLSGPAEIHDRYRKDKAGRNTYRRILRNLRNIPETVEIYVTGQYDPYTDDYLRFPEIVDDINSGKLSAKLGEVSFGPFSSIDFDGRKESVFGVMKDCSRESDAQKYIWLQDAIRDRGGPIQNSPPYNRCLANYRHTIVIDVDGRLSPCPSLMDFPELNYGDVYQGVDFRKEAGLRLRSLHDKCRHTCAIAPLCDGGCRLQALVETGSFNETHCLEESSLSLVKTYIRRLLNDL